MPTLSRRDVLETLLGAAALAHLPDTASAQRPTPGPAERWRQLPATPPLPAPNHSALVPSNEASVFVAEYGTGDAVLMLHGGLGSSNYYAHQIVALALRHRVIAIDTRGHGRSPYSGSKLTYDLFARDALAVMDHLKLDTAAAVGWSDGGVTALQLAMTAPDRVTRAFVFGANADPSGYIPNGASRSAVFKQYVDRCRAEYASLSPHPDRFELMLVELRRMWRSEPQFTKNMLGKVRVPVTVTLGEFDEIIKPNHAAYMAAAMPGGKSIVLPRVSHFAMIQDPASFNQALDDFLRPAT